MNFMACTLILCHDTLESVRNIVYVKIGMDHSVLSHTYRTKVKQ